MFPRGIMDTCSGFDWRLRARLCRSATVARVALAAGSTNVQTEVNAVVVTRARTSESRTVCGVGMLGRIPETIAF